MLGDASVPRPLPRAASNATEERDDGNRRTNAIHVASAPRIREVSMNESTAPRVASAAAADAVADASHAAADVRAQLTAPNRDTTPLPTIQQPADLRAYIGRRDPRDSIAAALGWAYDLGMTIDGTPTRANTDAKAGLKGEGSKAASKGGSKVDGSKVDGLVRGLDVVAWAERNDRLHDATTPPERGDLLVFDKVASDDDADLIGIVVSRDERNVTEFVYVGNGIVRRGFIDVTRPKTKRDKNGAVVNTFLRHTKRWPNKGSHYLAGEHLAYVIR